MSELSNTELSGEVAVRCGWTKRSTCRDESVPHRYPAAESHWHSSVAINGIDCWENIDSLHIDMPPRFAESLDACLAPGGPVEYAKAKGWGYQLSERGHKPWWMFLTVIDAKKDRWLVIGSAYDESPARALCLAFLAATEARDE